LILGPLLGAVIWLTLAYLACASDCIRRFSWDSPTNNTDGTRLTNLAGFVLSHGRTSLQYTVTADVGMTNQVLGVFPPDEQRHVVSVGACPKHVGRIERVVGGSVFWHESAGEAGESEGRLRVKLSASLGWWLLFALDR
jgi:hypothetical protein